MIKTLIRTFSRCSRYNNKPDFGGNDALVWLISCYYKAVYYNMSMILMTYLIIATAIALHLSFKINRDLIQLCKGHQFSITDTSQRVRYTYRVTKAELPKKNTIYTMHKHPHNKDYISTMSMKSCLFNQ